MMAETFFNVDHPSSDGRTKLVCILADHRPKLGG